MRIDPDGLLPLLVAAGDNHTCATRADGTVWCWGMAGRLGDGQGTSSTSPVQVFLLENATQVSAGNGHTCAVTSPGGGLLLGLQRVRLPRRRDEPGAARPGPGAGADDLAAAPGRGVDLGARQPELLCRGLGGAAWCRGWNNTGRFGNGGNLVNDLRAMAAYGGATDIARLEVGDTSSCAVTTAGVVRCSGTARTRTRPRPRSRPA